MAGNIECIKMEDNDNKTIELTSEFGKIRGRIKHDMNENKYYSFEGIPYVEAPIGSLRFKSPLPLINNLIRKDYFDATKKANISPANLHTTESYNISEDCLYLNIYVPESDDYPLPVMVYIHDGNFNHGFYANNFERELELLINKNIILVTFNYRLGVLGFLTLNDYLLDITGNGGLKDMVALLQWIKNNIRYFYGNPNNVTIIGSGVGGAAAHLMMFSPMAKGLFHKVIIQNGCALSPWVFVPHMDLKLADICNYDGFTNAADIYKYLKKQPTETLLKAQSKLLNETDICVGENKIFGPVIEIDTKNSFITKDPKQILLSGDYYKVPIMIGYSSAVGLKLKDSSEFIFSEMKNTEYDKYYVPRDIQNILLNPVRIQKLGNKIKNFYLSKTTSYDDFVETILTDFGYIKPIRKCIKAHAKNYDKIYYYTQNVSASEQSIKPDHSASFSTLFEDIKTLNILVAMWSNFAQTGDPNPLPYYENILKWESVEPNVMNCLHIGNELNMKTDPFGLRISQINKIINDELSYKKPRECNCSLLKNCPKFYATRTTHL